MNNNNSLKLKVGAWGRVMELSQVVDGKNLTVFLPTVKAVANARVVEVNEDGSVAVHWDGNFNLSGDFRTELMQFDNNLTMDNLDFEERNELRVANGLVAL